MATFCAACATYSLESGPRTQWYKGNTHLHTLWSDGDAAPEVAVHYYKERGYNFINVSDHNSFWTGERWYPVDRPLPGRDKALLTGQRLAEIEAEFGADWPVVRDTARGRDMRLKSFDEVQPRFEEPGRFMLIRGEEITSTRSVHVNGVNLAEFIPPAGGATVPDILQANLDAVAAQRAHTSQRMFAHVNHPNWGGRITAEDLLAVQGARFFEVFNGHGGVRNWGQADLGLPPTDALWDVLLAMRLQPGGEGVIYGLATDDTHHYFVHEPGNVSGGRGFTVVLAPELSADAIVRALEEGEFYSSSGVLLESVRLSGKRLIIRIQEEFGVRYSTQFIGTRAGFPVGSTPRRDAQGNEFPRVTREYSPQIGEVLHTTTANPAVYRLRGDELYVRARIVSSRPHPNPFAAGDREMAWVQPVVPRRSKAGR